MEIQRRKDGGGGGGGGSSSQREGAPPDAAGRTTTRQQHVKVKHIVTTEVRTNKASFKDVVQSLTGKDSGAARAAAVAAGGGTNRSRSNDASWAGGAAGAANNDTVAGVPPSSAAEEMQYWFWERDWLHEFMHAVRSVHHRIYILDFPSVFYFDLTVPKHLCLMFGQVTPWWSALASFVAWIIFVAWLFCRCGFVPHMNSF
jgi:hypothetical protein